MTRRCNEQQWLSHQSQQRLFRAF